MYNNYGNFNPYMGQNRFQPMEQPMAQQTTQIMPNMNSQRGILNGKQVESIDTAKLSEFLMDGSINYLPLSDKSAIVTKQLKDDGKCETIIYKRIEDEKDLPKYATIEDINKAIKEIDFGDLDDIKDEIKDLKSQIKDIKRKKD